MHANYDARAISFGSKITVEKLWSRLKFVFKMAINLILENKATVKVTMSKTLVSSVK